MKALRTSDDFVFVTSSKGEALATFSMRSKIQSEALAKSVGKNVMDLLAFNVGKLVDTKTLEVTDPE